MGALSIWKARVTTSGPQVSVSEPPKAMIIIEVGASCSAHEVVLAINQPLAKDD